MSEIDGLGKLRLWIGLLIVAELLADLVLLVVVKVTLSALPPSEVLIQGSLHPSINAQALGKKLAESGEASGFSSTILLAGVLAFISLILLIVVLIKAIRGFDTLNNYVKGSYLGVYGIITLFISAIVSAIARNSASSLQVLPPTMLIGDAIGMISYILIGLAPYNIGKFYSQSLLKLGVVLIIIPFGLIGDLIPLLISPI